MANRNANTDYLTIASNMADARKGSTFTGIITRLGGSERLAPGEKRGGEKIRYGDHLVHDLIITGFSYESLVQRSLDTLNTLSIKALANEFINEVCYEGRGKNAVERTVTVADVTAAIDDLRTSFNSTLNGTNESTNAHVFEPLVVDGESVRGGKVYNGGTTSNPKDPQDGDVHISGLRIAHKVIEEAEHGSLPKSKSAGKSVAKKLIKRKLPVGRYVSYRLRAGDDFILRVGGAAAIAAKDHEVEVRNTTVEAVFGICA
jgi:hypothetical protein